jgi:creatinine amidohydrolase
MDAQIRYELMRPGEIVAAREQCPITYVPVSPIEWHGPHLPLGTDGLVAHHLALRVARRTGGVVLPPLFAGTDGVRPPGHGPGSLGALGFTDDERIFGMDFPGNAVKSLYYEESAFGLAVRELVRGLKADPFRLIVLMNFHGAGNHRQTLQRIAVEETVAAQVHVVLHPSGNRPRPPDMDPGHAERWETSMVLAVAEEHVQLSALPPLPEPLPYPDYGIVEGQAFAGHPAPDFVLPRAADPRYSSREEGARIIEAIVDFTVEEVRRQLQEVLTARASS